MVSNYVLLNGMNRIITIYFRARDSRIVLNMAEIQKSTNEKRTEEFVARILHLMGGAKIVKPDRLVGVNEVEE